MHFASEQMKSSSSAVNADQTQHFGRFAGFYMMNRVFPSLPLLIFIIHITNFENANNKKHEFVRLPFQFKVFVESF